MIQETIQPTVTGLVYDSNDKAIAGLTDFNVPLSERTTRFRMLLNEGFDVQQIGRFVLGRYWRDATEVEQKEYLKLFEDLILATYAGRFSEYSGETLTVLDAKADEDRFTLVRWIDLGCPIDLDYQPQQPDVRGLGWMLDDNRPVLTVTHPQPGLNARLTRLLIGMHDYYSGLDLPSFNVTADFAVNGAAPGENLAAKFKLTSQGVWELPLDRPLSALPQGRLTVSVKDQQGNVSRIERTFSIGATKVAARE